MLAPSAKRPEVLGELHEVWNCILSRTAHETGRGGGEGEEKEEAFFSFVLGVVFCPPFARATNAVALMAGYGLSTVPLDETLAGSEDKDRSC